MDDFIQVPRKGTNNIDFAGTFPQTARTTCVNKLQKDVPVTDWWNNLLTNDCCLPASIFSCPLCEKLHRADNTKKLIYTVNWSVALENNFYAHVGNSDSTRKSVKWFMVHQKLRTNKPRNAVTVWKSLAKGQQNDWSNQQQTIFYKILNWKESCRFRLRWKNSSLKS